jgi:hypothetical protein
MFLLEMIAELRSAGIHFEMFSYRVDAITLVATVPGERWEIEVFADGTVQFERFSSTGEIVSDLEALRAEINAQRENESN